MAMKAAEQRALTQIREDAASLIAALGSRAGAQTVYLAELAAGGQGLEDAGGNRVLGRGCFPEQAPRFARKPMVHVLTLDLSQVPGVTRGYGAARAISVYVHNLEEYSGLELGEKETRVVPSLEAPTTDADGIPFVLHPVLVPAVATLGGDDDAAMRGLLSKRGPPSLAVANGRAPTTSRNQLQRLRKLLHAWSPGYVGGHGPVGAARPEYGHFLLQWRDIPGLNLGDGRRLVVYEEGGFCGG
jgi:hypothetical protein